jgi:hypothetical protein
MVDLWSKCPIQKLWKIFKYISMQNFTFFWGPYVFLLFLFSPVDLFNWKREFKMEKIFAGHIPLSQPISIALPAQPISANWPCYFPPLGHCQAGPSASRTQHVSPTSSRVDTVLHPTRYGTRYPPKPISFLCSGFTPLTGTIPVDRSPSSRAPALPRWEPAAAPSGPITYRGVPLRRCMRLP